MLTNTLILSYTVSMYCVCVVVTLPHVMLGNISKFNRIVILKYYRVWSYAPR